MSPVDAVALLLAIPVAFTLGVLYWFMVRKLTARFQWRRGPLLLVYRDLSGTLGSSRLLQPLYDILKLWKKEVVVPPSARRTLFKASPYIAAIFAGTAILFLPAPYGCLLSSFTYSLVVASYLLVGAMLFIVLGAASSSSPWGVIGARREAELFLAYEMAFIVSIFTAAYMYRSLSIWEISINQLKSLPGFLANPFAAILLFLAALGKLHLKPFDIPEAEQEIIAGPYTEYSGKLLALLYITKLLILYSLATLIIYLFTPLALYCSTPLGATLHIILSLAVIALLSLLHAANPRYRIDQALSWYAKSAAAFGLAAVLMAASLKLMGVL